MSGPEFAAHTVADRFQQTVADRFQQTVADRFQQTVADRFQQTVADRFQQTVVPWTTQTRDVVLRAARYLHRATARVPLFADMCARLGPVGLVCVRDTHEFGCPHTLDRYIFLPTRTVSRGTDDVMYLARILWHECVHVYQRNVSDIRLERLYRVLGFAPASTAPAVPIPRGAIVVQNPDTNTKPYWTYNCKRTYVFVCYVLNGGKMVRAGFVWTGNAWRPSRFVPFAGRVAQYEHPYEVVAELFARSVQ